jgi:hypothetical protein
MTRILVTLASFSLILLVVTLAIGLSIGDLYEWPQPTAETQHWAAVHRLMGLVAALGVVFVESIVVTYFIGTSRWCKEVVETYQLAPTAVRQCNRLKRRTFPWSLAGMLAVVGMIALGAAADPSTGQPNTKSWTVWHLFASFAGIGLIAATYAIAWINVLENHAITGGLVDEVQQIRQQRGLAEINGIGERNGGK